MVKTTGVVCVAASPFTLQVCAFFVSAPFSLECAKSVYHFVETNLCARVSICVCECVYLLCLTIICNVIIHVYLSVLSGLF